MTSPPQPDVLVTEVRTDVRTSVTGSAAGVLAVSTLTFGLTSAIAFLAGFMGPEIRADLGLSRTQLGLVVSTYFGATGVASFWGGVAADGLGARRAAVVSLATVSMGALSLGVWGTYAVLLAVAAVCGTAYALANAATNLAIAGAVPAARLTASMSLKTAGVPALSAVTAVIAPPLSERVGWQPVMVAVGVCTGVLAVVASRVLPTAGSAGAARPSGRTLPPRFVWLPLAAFFLIGGSQPLYSWLVPYLREGLDVAASSAGLVSSAASLVGVFGMIAIGGRIDRRGAGSRVPAIVTLCALCATGTVLVALGAAAGLVPVAIGAVLASLCQLAVIGTLHAVIVDAAPHAVGRATGITLTGYYLGAFVSPTAFGALADATGRYAWSWVMCVGMLVVATASFAAYGATSR